MGFKERTEYLFAPAEFFKKELKGAKIVSSVLIEDERGSPLLEIRVRKGWGKIVTLRIMVAYSSVELSTRPDKDFFIWVKK